MQESGVISIPEQGQTVTVRQRRYVVTDVLPSTLPPSLLAGRDGPRHFVTLASIKDNALGESLQVIWELEPGARVSEKVEQLEPTDSDAPRRLDALLDALRSGAIACAEIGALQAPFRSGLEIEDYQLDPLVRAVQMSRANLLVADDVGLGKTIEAGLIIQELIVRSRAQTVLVVYPAGLQIHWHDQMRDKFRLEFRIVDSQLVKRLRHTPGIHVNPWAHFPRLIMSIDFIKREGPVRLFREVLPAEGETTHPHRFDILVVDAALNLAPSGSGRHAIDSLRIQAVRTIAPHFEHKLFLDATYNRFHDPDEAAEEIARLRELHVEMDRAVAADYGWDDLDLGHGFHETAQGLRFTIREPTRREVLTRLLELNHERYAEEVRQGLHEKKGKKTVRKRSMKRKKTDDRQMSLF